MARPNNTLVDGALILTGAGISTLFVTTDGNGRNPVPVAEEMMILVLFIGLVSFLLARIVRTIPLAIIASVIITDMLSILWGEHQLRSFQGPYADEAIMMFPIIFLVETAPAVLLSSVGFGRLASRFWRNRTQTDEK